jgi:hypothetical protein
MLACYLMGKPIDSRETLDVMVPDIHRLLPSGRIMPHYDAWPTIVKTHFLPDVEVMQSYRPLARKVVYLVRNPRDVLISSARLLGIEDDRRRAFARSFIAGRGAENFRFLSFGTWPQHVRAWTSMDNVRRYFPHVTKIRIVRYESIRHDPAGELRGILEFLGFEEIGPDQVSAAVGNSSLDKMKKTEEIERRGGVNRFHDKPVPARFINDGLQAQSLAVFGEDVEESYQDLLRYDDEFSRCARQFGYLR